MDFTILEKIPLNFDKGLAIYGSAVTHILSKSESKWYPNDIDLVSNNIESYNSLRTLLNNDCQYFNTYTSYQINIPSKFIAKWIINDVNLHLTFIETSLVDFFSNLDYFTINSILYDKKNILSYPNALDHLKSKNLKLCNKTSTKISKQYNLWISRGFIDINNECQEKIKNILNL